MEEEITKVALDRNLKTTDYINSEVDNQLRETRMIIDPLATNSNLVNGDCEEKKTILAKIAESLEKSVNKVQF